MVRISPEKILSRVGGLPDQVGVRLFQLSTKLKLKLKLSLEISISIGYGCPLVARYGKINRKCCKPLDSHGYFYPLTRARDLSL